MPDSGEKDLPDTPPKTVKRPKLRQSFVSTWLSDERFKNWLVKVPGDVFKARCKLCDQILTADSSVLLNHKKALKHQSKENPILLNAPKITNFMKPVASHGTTTLDTNVTIAEIQLTGFFAENNIALNLMDKLTPTLKNIFHDSPIAEKLALKRTKATAVVTNVIGASEKAELTQKLKNIKFSILTDESTDISTIKSSCYIVRYYDEKEGKIVSKFWELSQVFDEDASVASATGEHLYSALIKSFKDQDIPMKNIIGFGSDGCNVMMGEFNSVASRLKRDFPGIVIFKCLCHSLHLAASCACKQLPRTVEDLARNVYNFFHASAKRLSAFSQFQVFTDTPVHSLLHPSQTRWLSLTAVVERMLEQWSALQLYFTEHRFEEKLVIAETIHNSLQDPFNKLYFLFLKWVLPMFSRVNQYFQSSKVVITDVHEKMTNLYRELLFSYMKRSYVVSTDLTKINPEDSSQFLPNAEMYLGVYVMTEMQKTVFIEEKEFTKFFQDKCRNFLIAGCLGIKKRYDFENPLLNQIRIFKPSAALLHTTRISVPSLSTLLSSLPRICASANLQDIDDEWRKLPSYPFDDEEKKRIASLETDAFWSELSTKKNDDDRGTYLFRKLSTVVLQILSLLHSNADSERIFSKINLIKTKARSKLIVPTINGLVLSSQNVKSSGGSSKFMPSKDMLSRMTSSNLYGNKKGNKEKTIFEKKQPCPSTSSAVVTKSGEESIEKQQLSDESDDEITFG